MNRNSTFYAFVVPFESNIRCFLLFLCIVYLWTACRFYSISFLSVIVFTVVPCSIVIFMLDLWNVCKLKCVRTKFFRQYAFVFALLFEPFEFGTKRKTTKFKQKQKYYWKIVNDEGKKNDITIRAETLLSIWFHASWFPTHFPIEQWRFVAMAAPQLQYLFRPQSAVWDYLCAEYALLPPLSCCADAQTMPNSQRPCDQCVCKLCAIKCSHFHPSFRLVLFFSEEKESTNNEQSQQLSAR